MDREVRKKFLHEMMAAEASSDLARIREDEGGLGVVVDKFRELFHSVRPYGTDDSKVREILSQLNWLSHRVETLERIVSSPRVVQLNGSHGEATESDDVVELFEKPKQIGGSHGETTMDDDLKNRSAGYNTQVTQEKKKKKKKKGLAGMLKKMGIKKQVGGALRGALSAALTGGNPLMGAATGFSGMGDYSPVVSNSIVHGSAASLEHAISSPSASGFRWSNNEYVTDIYSQAGSSYSTIVFPVNAGLSQTFRFFSQIAANFDKYRFRQLIFKLKSVYSTYSSTGNLGSCFVAFVTNAGSIPFTSKPALMEYSGAVSAKVSQDIVMGVECNPSGASSGGWYYSRNGPVPAGQTIQQYDPGFIQVALSGVPTSGQVYELHVSYEVEVADPKLWQSIGYMIPLDRFLGGGTIGTANYVGSAPFECSTNSIGCILTKNSTNRVIFPDSFSGTVRVQIWLQTSVFTGAIVMTKSPTGNIVDYTDLVVSGAAASTITVGAAGNVITMYDYTVSVSPLPGANYITMSGLSALTASNVTLEVIGLNGFVGPFGVGGQGMILA